LLAGDAELPLKRTFREVGPPLWVKRIGVLPDFDMAPDLGFTCIHEAQPNRLSSVRIQKDLVTFGFAKVAPLEVFRKISQNFSPAGVTSPLVARAIPTDIISFVPVSGR
jgi:hypothetical protein